MEAFGSLTAETQLVGPGAPAGDSQEPLYDSLALLIPDLFPEQS